MASAPRFGVALTALVVLSLGVFLALFAVPNDADQGVSQRIFYLHVPSALAAYGCFLVGGYKAARLLATRHANFELESHTAIHLGLVFAVIAIATGSIWARVSWGVWWTWEENQLVLFLILFLFYAAYFMLRYSLPAGTARANISAVYAVFGLVLNPVSFLAVRLAQRFIHPVVFSRKRSADGVADARGLLRLPRRRRRPRSGALPDRARRAPSGAGARRASTGSRMSPEVA